MSEECCHRSLLLADADGRRRFALPDARPHYAPDRPARVEHISLSLDFDFAEKILFGRCATRFTAVASGLTAIEMDAAQLCIRNVATSGGKTLPFQSSNGKLRIHLPKPLPPGKSGEVVIDYEAHQPRMGIFFIGPDAGYPDKPVHVWTQSQDQDAHYWFPCIDHPNAKATTELRATVPADFFVLSNGELVATAADAKRKTKTYHWKMDVPHVTYLVSCVAGRFAGHTDRVDGIPVSYYVHPGREEDGRRSFGKTPQMIKFFAERLSFPYPYAKYAQIAVSDFIFGGMENTTATTQTDTTLHDARAHLDFSSDGLVAHELAHQWFGDLLTCKDWSHAWLNEGFATYFDALFREHDLGEDEFQYHRLELQERYKAEDREHYRRPIVTNVFGEPIELFDRHLYEKGACVLHMIRTQLGDDLWWQAMRHYVQANQQRLVETVDLARSIEAVSGRNLQPFFDQWIFKAGHPEFKVAFEWDPESKIAAVHVSQTQTTDGETSLFEVAVGVCFLLAGGQKAEYPILCDASHQTFYFTLPSKPLTFRFDPAADILKTVSLQVPREMLVRQLRSDVNVAGRVEAARTLAQEKTAEVIDALADALQRDPFWGVRAEAAKALGQIKGDRAFRVLCKARKTKHPKARRAVAEALGEFRGDEACAALKPLLDRDRSYFVERSAATSIGKTKSSQAYDLLVSALHHKESWNETIRCGAIAGFAALGDERAVPDLLAWMRYGKPLPARKAAIAALAKLGENRSDVREALLAALDDKAFSAQMAAVDALETMREPAALAVLDRMALQDIDGRLKRRCAVAAQTIRQRLARPAENRRMREELDALRDANVKLQERLALLEHKTRGARV